MTSSTTTQRSKLPVNMGDWIDPAGAVEVIHHRWYFCKAMEEAAQDVLKDLFSLDALVDQALAPPANEALYDENLTPALNEWCDRWHIRPAWLLGAAINTLVWRYAARQKIGASLRPVFLPAPFGPEIPPELMTKVLEDLNPGWSDMTYRFVVPEFAFSWHPTQHTKLETRAEAHRFLDQHLDTVFAEAEEQLKQGGYRPATKGQAGTVKLEHYVWAVHHYLHQRNWSELAREFKGQHAVGASPAKIRRAAERLDESLHLSEGGKNDS